MYPKKDLVDAWTQAVLLMDSPSTNQREVSSNLIESIEVKEPILLNSITPTCSVQIAQRLFANSYGNPFVGKYVPKPECGNSWSQVVLRYYATVSGRQFDRVGGVWIGGSEIMRYTGAEPSGPSLTFWDTKKDVTEYSQLFKKEQDVVVSLDNVVNEMYTGIFNVTVSLDFYRGDEPADLPDMIIPLSASSDYYGWFTLPDAGQPGTVLPPLPQNVIRAEVKAYISGHSQDEFWYGNVPNSVSQEGLYGGGPFKELQLLLDDQVVGLDWPFPTIYTGGFNPLLWRPVVAIGAHDVPEMTFDLTPFLPLLFNGTKPHKLSFNVTDAANPFWFVDGNLKLWLDKDAPANHTFQGKMESLSIPRTVPKDIIQGSIEEELEINTVATNSISASSTFLTSKGWKKVEYRRSVEYKNQNTLKAGGNNQTNDQLTKISTLSTVQVQDTFQQVLDEKNYPFYVRLNYTKNDAGQYDYEVYMDHGLESFVKKDLSKEPSQKTVTRQIAYGNFGTIRPGTGNLEQTFEFSSPQQCYKRNIKVENRRIVRDELPPCGVESKASRFGQTLLRRI